MKLIASRTGDALFGPFLALGQKGLAGYAGETAAPAKNDNGGNSPPRVPP
ncbi:hypothetical protein CBM2637_B70075 [Cupriavidus taiwanensis]|nr:hypothetical protein CBM2637_B70075 [Cupriavidus taiwanensis]